MRALVIGVPQTMTPDFSVRLATPQDVPAVTSLEGRYFVDNLDEAKRASGFVSVRHSEEWFGQAVDEGGLHVAHDSTGAIRGFIAVTPPPDPVQPGLSPVVAAMLKLAAKLEYQGEIIASQQYAFRGPVVIDQTARGHGLYTKFNSVTSQAYRGRFDLGVLFVAAGNPRSLHTTTTKLGATVLATFQVGDAPFHFLAFGF